MTEDSLDLKGRRALVTGGSRGLGRAISLAYAEHGADIVIASRKLGACEVLAEEIQERFGRKALAVACNVSDWNECDQLIDKVNATWGGVDVLVNNAGISPLYSAVSSISEELFDKVLAVNLKGPFRLSTRLGDEMVARGGGTIINISSLSAIRPTADVVPYAAAKSGLNNMTESLAAAFGPTVRVNAIMPGRFATDVSAHWDKDIVAAAVAGHALGRVGKPEEIVGAAVYFASDASSFCTGAVLRVDGGVP
jgi:NAD(P)-dependent dehydrogenase (short-subunit alcohol dehydrogenase family)